MNDEPSFYSIALGNCDDDDGDELDLREIVDVGKELIEECDALKGDVEEGETDDEQDDAVIFEAMLPDKPF